jgi:hypothetical protein
MDLAPPHKRLSDRQVLQRLLDSKKLSEDELREARSAYLRVIAGDIFELEPQTRGWADRLYFEYKLGGQDHREVARRKKAKKDKQVTAGGGAGRARSDQPH